ncbi:MAG: Tfp pilus assembly protein PilF [Bradymonadia bacterium]
MAHCVEIAYDSRMMTRLAIALALLWSTPGAAQPSAAEAHVALGDWEEAAVVYAAEAEGSTAPASWYRLGVVQAIAGDPGRAASSFRRVEELDSQFPEIQMRIAAADARAQWELAQSADPDGFSEDAEVRAGVRERALDNGDVVASARAASGSVAGSDGVSLQSPQLDAAEHALLGEILEASNDAVQALGDAPSERHLALAASDYHRRAGDLQTARYFLRLYNELGGDPALSVPVRRAIENADLLGAP